MSFANAGLSDPLPPAGRRDASPETKYAAPAMSSSPPNVYADPYRPGTTGTTGSSNGYARPLTPVNGADDALISNAAPIGRSDGRQPTLPNLGYGGYAPAPLRTYGMNTNGYGGGYGGPPPSQQQQQQRQMNFSAPYRGY